MPTGEWSADVPMVPQGKYLWVRTTITFNSGAAIVSYCVSRMGIDGSGSVVSVNGVAPDNSGNIQLAAADIPAGDDQTVGGKLEALDTGVSNAATAASAAATAAKTAQETASSAATAAGGKQDKITATGLLKGTGSAVGAAQAGVDYQPPLTAGVDYQAPLTGANGKYVGFSAENVPEAMDLPSASTTAKGITYLVDSYTSTDTDRAVTPKAVNEVYKLLPISTSVELTVDGWSNGVQTVSVAGVTTTDHVIVAPCPDAYPAYISSNVRCTAQGDGTLMFTATTTPTAGMVINVIILKQ